MAQQTFPGGRYVRYSKPEIPKKHMAWFVKMLVAFAIVLALGVAYGFWRIANVPQPKVDLPAGAETRVVGQPPAAEAPRDQDARPVVVPVKPAPPAALQQMEPANAK